MPLLSEIGERICIIGTSSSGKSTLAEKLGEKLNLPVWHLDELAHISHTEWVRKDNNLFKTEHDAIIEKEQKWILEGNYSFLMKERFAKASFIIWLDFNPFGSFLRYIKRTFFRKQNRVGKLKGSSEKFSWDLVYRMFFIAPKNRQKYRKLIAESNKSYLHLKSFSELKELYKKWNLNFK